MERLLDIQPIRFFSFYLMLMFVISTGLRFRQYRAMLSILLGLRNRWPNLTQLVLSHRNIFLSWGTFRPLAVMLLLLVGNLLASRLVWPQADRLRLWDLLPLWPALIAVALSGLAMLAFDAYGTFRVGEIDRDALEKHFDQAEYWLRGWQAPVVRVLSLGFVNPRQIVAQEVRSALESASQLLNDTMWWVSVQTTLRIVFGLCLWGTAALEVWLRAVVLGG